MADWPVCFFLCRIYSYFFCNKYFVNLQIYFFSLRIKAKSKFDCKLQCFIWRFLLNPPYLLGNLKLYEIEMEMDHNNRLRNGDHHSNEFYQSAIKICMGGFRQW